MLFGSILFRSAGIVFSMATCLPVTPVGRTGQVLLPAIRHVLIFTVWITLATAAVLFILIHGFFIMAEKKVPKEDVITLFL